MGNQKTGPVLLSIIVPFHNSTGKADLLLGTLCALDEQDVEIILVDDGSTDDTVAYLTDFQRRFRCASRLVRQRNKGPGGARNHGLDIAAGRYVWFADSDDDISLSAIAVLREHADAAYDFIDFEILSFSDHDGPIKPSHGARAGGLQVAEGDHVVRDEERLGLLHSVGWLWSKIFRRDFLTENEVRYPEYCVYEDSPLFFLYPFLVKRFFKSLQVGYHHHQERESVTRSAGAKGPRFYDRLLTASRGVDLAEAFFPQGKLRERIQNKFINIFLVHTLRIIQAADGDWMMMMRVMRFYREEADRLNLGTAAVRMIHGRMRYRLKIRLLWLASRCLPPQAEYFEALHFSAWGRPIEYP